MEMHAGEIALVVAMIVHVVSGNGRLLEPPQRSSLWRDPNFYNNRNVFRNYNDHTLDCGGWWKMSLNNGKCGVCGDPWDSPEPRPNEAGGTYGRSIISRTYTTDKRYIDATVQVTSSMGGFFEFSICPLNDAMAKVEHECFYNHSMRINSKNRVTSYGRQYFLDLTPGKTGIIELSLEIPEGLECKNCVLRWHWHGANNFGVCKNGRWNKGCGDQSEIYNCADISIISEKDNHKEVIGTNAIVATIDPMKITTAALHAPWTLSETLSTPAKSVSSSETTLGLLTTSNATTSTTSPEALIITTEQSANLLKATAVSTITTVPPTISQNEATSQSLINIIETQSGTSSAALIATTSAEFATRTMTTGFPESSKEPNVTSQLAFASTLTDAESRTTQTNSIFSTHEVPTTIGVLSVPSFVGTRSLIASASTEAPPTIMPITTAESATNITTSTKKQAVTQSIVLSTLRENPVITIQFSTSSSSTTTQTQSQTSALLENSSTSSSNPITTASLALTTTLTAETETSASSIQTFADATTDGGSVVIPFENSTTTANVAPFVTSFSSVVPLIASSVTLEQSLPILEKRSGSAEPVTTISLLDSATALTALTTYAQSKNNEQTHRNRTTITNSSQLSDTSEMFTPLEINVNDIINGTRILPLVNSFEISGGITTLGTTLPNWNEINKTIETMSLLNGSLIKEEAEASSNAFDNVMHDALKALDNLNLESSNTTVHSFKDNATALTLGEKLRKSQFQDITLQNTTENNNLVTKYLTTFTFSKQSEHNSMVSNNRKSGFSGDIMVATLFPFKDILDANLYIANLDVNKGNQRTFINKPN